LALSNNSNTFLVWNNFYLGIKFGLCPFHLFSFLMKKPKSHELISIISIIIILIYFFFRNDYVLKALVLILFSITFTTKTIIVIEYIWMALLQILNAISSKIFLTAFYFIILMPYSLIYKCFKKFFIVSRNNKNNYPYSYGAKDFENPW
jgi:hypothetical protein